MVYIVFFVVLFLLWAKPVEIVDDYTEVDSHGHIIRVNGMPFAEYLAKKGIDIRDIDIADKEFYLANLEEKEKNNELNESSNDKEAEIIDPNLEKDVSDETSVTNEMESTVSSEQIEMEVHVIPEESQDMIVNDVDEGGKDQVKPVEEAAQDNSVEPAEDSIVDSTTDYNTDPTAETINESVSESLSEPTTESADNTNVETQEAHHHDHIHDQHLDQHHDQHDHHDDHHDGHHDDHHNHHHHHDHHHHHRHHETTDIIPDEYKHPYLAVFLTTISAMAATVGGAFVVFVYPPSSTSLSYMLSFSAGIMLYISFMDIMVHAQMDLGEHGMFEANLAMFVGMIGFLLLVHLIPDFNPSDDDKDKTNDQNKDKNKEESAKKRNLELTGLITALGISLHNLPEGLIVFNATVVGVCDVQATSVFSLDYLLHCTGRGLVVAIAIAIHNIPEGIAVALPIYMSTKSKWSALKYCLISSICEPLAAIVFGLLFSEYLTTSLMAIINAMVAGIMIILCVYELLPTALDYSNAKTVAIGTIVGMFVMFISLYFLIETGAH